MCSALVLVVGLNPVNDNCGGQSLTPCSTNQLTCRSLLFFLPIEVDRKQPHEAEDDDLTLMFDKPNRLLESSAYKLRGLSISQIKSS
jgi:hypothetical protein